MGKASISLLVHDHEPFLQVLTFFALVAGIFERQIASKLR